MQNSEEFLKEKEKNINKLKTLNFLISRLESVNNDTIIVNENDLSKIRDIFDKNLNYINKLENNEFEIAIVGLEKAGKSTFANALIKNSILPSAPERCTYTSTRLNYGEDDKGIVEFYTEEEFNKIFVSLLKDIEYPNYEEQNFRDFSLDEFEEFFDDLEENNIDLYKAHIGKTDEEIKDILNYRDNLILTGDKKEFFKEELSGEDFQSYIKGEKKNNETDTSKPRSVKRIEIISSKLDKLKNAIIYDVPGFDSPTKIHERQTLERLKNADAIILVTNVGRNPSLLGTQLNILSKETDSDGIKLKDKLFVFGNQIDLVNREEDIENNTNILKRDVEKRKIGVQKRVFVGSALKYLIDNGVVENDGYYTRYEFDTGIDNIYNELVRYYETERFKILKSKIIKNEKDVKEIFSEISNNFEIEEIDENYIEHEKRILIDNGVKEVENSLKNNLKKLRYDLKYEMKTEKSFSKRFQDIIDNSSYFNKIDENYIKEVKIRENSNLTLDVPVEKINQSVREELHNKFLKEFSLLLNDITNDELDDMDSRLFDIFVKSFNLEQNHILLDEIELELKKMIKRLSGGFYGNDCNFAFVMERFARDVIDVLIASPLFSEDRRNKFENVISEFVFLDNCYSNGNKKLINILLVGKDIKKEPKISGLISSLLGLTELNDLSVIHNIANEIKEEVENPLMEYVNDILQGGVRSKNENDILLEINRDIENLKDILKNGVTPAIGLENIFLNRIDKQITSLVDSFNHKDYPEKYRIFSNFIFKVVNKLKADEIENMDELLEKNKKKQEFLKDIQEFIF